MPKKDKIDLTKHTLHLRKGDMEFLKDAFPAKGASLVIRRLVSNFVDKLNKPLSPEELEELEPTDGS